MKIFLNKLLLATKDKFVMWEYLEKFDSLIGFHIDYDVTITKRNLSIPRFSVIVNTSEGGHARFDISRKDPVYPLLMKIKTTAIKNAIVIST